MGPSAVARSAPRAFKAAARLNQRESLSILGGSRRIQIPSSTSSPANHRALHHGPSRMSQSATASNPAMSFPCLDAQDAKSAQLSARSLQSGPEPSYTTGHHEQFHCEQPLLLD